MTEQEPAACLQGVSVRYGGTDVLRDVTADFPAGAVGVLGPNGAGKTTLIRVLLGLVAPTAGRVRVLGLDVAADPTAVRARIGFMPENDAYIPGSSAVSFVAYCGRLAGLTASDAMRRAHDVLFYVGLGEARYRNVETYSTGMKQRIKLAQALVHDPDLVFLDEPTNGMDPKGRDEMLALCQDLVRRQGVHLVLSSHLLPDVEHVCDHVVVMEAGRVAAQGPLSALVGPRGRLFELRVKEPHGGEPSFVDRLRAAGYACHGTAGDMLLVTVPDTEGARGVFSIAAASGVQVRHLRPSIPTLEDAFARALGES
jgi:ABC-2 type transport system ATP-binding protein